MNRNLTNAIRFVMDECLPPVVRDNKWFMYPFFYLAYRGKNIRQVMNFKKEVYYFSQAQYEAFYNDLDSISRNRLTDLNAPSVKNIIESVSADMSTLADIGCGNGYLLGELKKAHPNLVLTGVDIKDNDNGTDYTYMKSNIDSLPFDDKCFDVVTCCHTLEHLLNPEQAIAELKRITKKLLIIAVPCQRYYFYTLDEHVNFFPIEETLTSLIGLRNYRCFKLNGDWLYCGYID